MRPDPTRPDPTVPANFVAKHNAIAKLWNALKANDSDETKAKWVVQYSRGKRWYFYKETKHFPVVAIAKNKIEDATWDEIEAKVKEAWEGIGQGSVVGCGNSNFDLYDIEL